MQNELKEDDIISKVYRNKEYCYTANTRLRVAHEGWTSRRNIKTGFLDLIFLGIIPSNAVAALGTTFAGETAGWLSGIIYFCGYQIRLKQDYKEAFEYQRVAEEHVELLAALGMHPMWRDNKGFGINVNINKE